ncbi:MAG: sigma-E processing peptidase SpoIIGA [Firmicutes bacterium]|nr:sigma-E processing peptidase SpoIIGA [Bacillota bacterium]
MTIYAEFLFLENALVGWLLLYLTGRLFGNLPGCRRLLLGSLLSGLAAFILFLPYQPLWLLALFRLFFPLGLILMVFGRKGGWTRIFRQLILFYLLSFGAGGITVGLLYFTETPGVTAGGFFYTGKLTWLHVGLGIVGSWLGLSFLVRFLRQRMQRQRTTASLRIVAGDRSISVRGFMDTGNFLRDPLSGCPVILAEEKVFQKLWPGGIPPSRFRLIPFQSLGASNGILRGVLPDAIYLETEPPRKLKKGVVIALCDETLSKGLQGEEYDLILHPEILEGEMICYA